MNMLIKKHFTHGFGIVSKHVWFSTRFNGLLNSST